MSGAKSAAEVEAVRKSRRARQLIPLNRMDMVGTLRFAHPAARATAGLARRGAIDARLVTCQLASGRSVGPYGTLIFFLLVAPITSMPVVPSTCEMSSATL
jgi:hypothetical protein